MDSGSMLPRPCADDSGTLPSCAPLAVPFVPVQQRDSKKYTQMDALANGTLFPGLNLPFHMKTAPSTLPAESAALELQALYFVISELGLYLDTHRNDTEAFRLFQQYSRLADEARHRYEQQYGPLTQVGAAQHDRYTWLDSPWPWEYEEGGRQ